MTDIDQRAFDAAYDELRDWVSNERTRAQIATELVGALKAELDMYGVEQVRELSFDRNTVQRANFAWNWGTGGLFGLSASEIGAAVAAAARVLAEG